MTDDQSPDFAKDALNFHWQHAERLRQLLYEAQLFLILATPDVGISTHDGRTISKTVLLGEIEAELGAAWKHGGVNHETGSSR